MREPIVISLNSPITWQFLQDYLRLEPQIQEELRWWVRGMAANRPILNPTSIEIS